MLPLYKIDKLVFNRNKEDSIFLCLYNTSIMCNLQIMAVILDRIPLGNKISIIYEAKCKYIAFNMLEELQQFWYKEKKRIGDRENS